jgi:hypothetical protein
MKGVDVSLQRWHKTIIRDKLIEDEDGRNKINSPDQILNMKLQKKKKKVKHRDFNIKAKMKKMTRLKQFRVWKKRKKKPNLSEELKSSFSVKYCKPR